MPDLSYAVTRAMLFDLMFAKGNDKALFRHKGNTYIFQGMDRESGDGSTVNVDALRVIAVGPNYVNSGKVSLFFRTLD